MGKVSEATVEVKADTSQFDRAMRKASKSLWFFQWSMKYGSRRLLIGDAVQTTLLVLILWRVW